MGATVPTDRLAADLRPLAMHDPAALGQARAILDESLGAGTYAPGALTADPDYYMIAAWSGDLMVGVAGARLLSPQAWTYYAPFGGEVRALFEKGPVGSLETSAVRAEHRGRGIGSGLAAARLDWLRQRGCSQVVGVSWLSGLSHGSARVFERHGFRRLSTAAQFYRASSEQDGWPCSVCGQPCLCPAALYILECP